MKKIFVIVYTLLIATALQAQPVKEHGALWVKGTQLHNAAGKPLVLRGVSFGWHNWWPRFYNAGSVHTLVQDWKATVIRAAIGVEPDGGYIKNPLSALQKTKAVVDAAVKEGVYVIIDWHSHNINLPEAKTFFTEMARTYGHQPNVIYEIFNEPEGETWAEVKAYSEAIVQVIRSVDPDNVILIGTPHWDQDIHLAADDPIKGYDNLMYTLHFYAATHKQPLRDRGDYALSKGLPLFISESAGMEASGDGPLNEAEWQAWIEWSEKNKISWVTWSIADKGESCSMIQAGAPADGAWKDSDLKASGIKTRILLRDYAAKEMRK